MTLTHLVMFNFLAGAGGGVVAPDAPRNVRLIANMGTMMNRM